MKKKNGFTLIELIITLSLTVVVLGVIYTFFLSNTKTLTSTELGVDLQVEAQNIQDEILKYGTESNGISKINNTILSESNSYTYTEVIDGQDLSTSNGKLDIKEIVFNVDGKEISFRYDSTNKTLKLFENNIEVKTLGSNVESIKIRPLDYKMTPNGSFYEVNGLEFSIILSAKKGYSSVKSPLSIIVKFRNK